VNQKIVMKGGAEQGQLRKRRRRGHMMGDASIRAKCQNYFELSSRYPGQSVLCGEACVELELPHHPVEQRDRAVQARYLGDTFLEVDSYGQGDLLGSEEAEGVMYEFEAVTDLLELVNLVAWGRVFANPAALGSFGIEEMLRSLTCGDRRMIRPYHSN
jgi:hypothetical protein